MTTFHDMSDSCVTGSQSDERTAIIVAAIITGITVSAVVTLKVKHEIIKITSTYMKQYQHLTEQQGTPVIADPRTDTDGSITCSAENDFLRYQSSRS